MLDFIRLVLGLIVDLFRSRAALEAEILVVCTDNLIRIDCVAESLTVGEG